MYWYNPVGLFLDRSELILRGVDRRTIRLVAVGPNEPVARTVYNPAKRAQNRRVEIIVRESLIDDYLGQAPFDDVTPTPPAEATTPESVALR